jgi:hypothetical protein
MQIEIAFLITKWYQLFMQIIAILAKMVLYDSNF